MGSPVKYQRTYAQNRRAMFGSCAHWRVLIIGNEEGLRSIKCEECGEPLLRRPNDAGEYDYYTVDEVK